jgi:6-phosphofructokinase
MDTIEFEVEVYRKLRANFPKASLSITRIDDGVLVQVMGRTNGKLAAVSKVTSTPEIEYGPPAVVDFLVQSILKDVAKGPS